MSKNYFLIGGMMLSASVGFSQTRYLSATGADGGNCTTAGTACATINYAVSQASAGDTVLLAPGNYTFATTQEVNKSVIISAASESNKPVITTTSSDVILVDAAGVVVKGLKINMGLTATNGIRGIVVNTENDNVSILNNEIISTKTLSTGMVFNAYAVATYGGNGNDITIKGNTIKPNTLLNDAFGRGIAVGINGLGNGAGGEISGNVVQAYYSIQSVLATADLEINDNVLSGTTMIGYPVDGVTIDITENTFSGENDLIAANLYALLEVRAVDNATVNIVDNEFSKYVNLGLLSSASRNVSVLDNSFTPSATATNFASIHANSKLMTSGTQGQTYSNGIEIKGNFFGAGSANNGAAIVFGDHYGVTAPAFENTITVGGSAPADKNTFNQNLKYFIQLDGSSGNSDANELWATYSVTTMKPFSQNVIAYTSWNTYPSNDTTVLAGKVYDINDNNQVGRVILEEPLSINNNKIVNLVSFPNPTTEVLYIQSSELTGNNTITIVDVQGRLVMSKNIASQGMMEVNVNELQVGMYTLRIANNGQFYTSRFVKK